jgi:ribose-phosphate pyrophosphokinase
MIIVGLSNSKELAKGIAQKLNLDFEDLELADSDEGELHVKFKHNLKGQKVVLVQSLYPYPNHALFEVLYTSGAARDLGAREVIYVAPYLAFLREDEREEKGECVNAKVLGEILNKNVDQVVSVEPHMHQHSFVKEIFSIPFHRLECGDLLRSYAKEKFAKEEVVGVGDKAGKLARHVDAKAALYEKFKINQNYKGKKVLVVDDIIFTGGTMNKVIESLKAKEVEVLTVHGLFFGDSYEKLKKRVEKIVSCNTLEHESNSIDVSGLIAGKLMEL